MYKIIKEMWPLKYVHEKSLPMHLLLVSFIVKFSIHVLGFKKSHSLPQIGEASCDILRVLGLPTAECSNSSAPRPWSAVFSVLLLLLFLVLYLCVALRMNDIKTESYRYPSSKSVTYSVEPPGTQKKKDIIEKSVNRKHKVVVRLLM